MNAWFDILDYSVIRRLGLTLLHFLWQGAVFAALWSCLRFWLRQHRPQLRYRTAGALFLLMACAPVGTFILLDEGAVTEAGGWIAVPGNSGSEGRPAPLMGNGWLGSLPGADARMLAASSRLLPWLVAAWVMGVAAFSVRLLFGFWSARRLAVQGTWEPAPEWREKVAVLMRRLELTRPVRLLVSAVVRVPTVVGWLRPVILVPACSLSGLTPEQLELILAHELAHIRRHDAWVNLFQVFVETLLFYHPAVWWISGCIRAERELCCDDLAVEACGNRVAYARALTTLESMRSQPATFAMGAAGGSLLNRVRHILRLEEMGAAGGWRVPVGNALLGVGLLLLVGGMICLSISPTRYTARCKLLVRADPESGLPQVSGSLDPYFLQTEAEFARSRPVLTEVVKRLKLDSRWGTAGNTEGGTESAIAELGRRMTFRSLPNSRVVEIRVEGQDREEAASLANAFAEVYRDQRFDADANAAKQGLELLRRDLDGQKLVVHHAQQNLDELEAKLAIPSSITERNGIPQELASETVRRLEAERISTQAQHTGMTVLLEKLRELRGRSGDSEFSKALLTAHPDTELGKLLQDTWTTEANLAKLRTTFAPDHPEVRQLTAMQEVLARNVEDRIEGIMTGLDVRVQAKQAELNSLQRAIEGSRDADIASSEQHRPYFIKRRDLEEAQKIRDAMLLRFLQEQVDLSLPSKSIQVIETALARQAVPVRAAGPLGAGLFAFGAACFLIGLVLRLTGRPIVTSPALA